MTAAAPPSSTPGPVARRAAAFMAKAGAVVVVWFALVNLIGGVVVGGPGGSLMGLLSGGCLAALGAFITASRPRHPIGWIYLVAGAAGTFGAATDGDRFALLGSEHPAAVLAVLNDVLWPLTFPLLCAALLWFPSGRLSRHGRLLAVPMAALIVSIAVLNVFATWAPDAHEGLHNPLALRLPPLPNLNAAVPPLALACVVSLCLRYRRFDSVERAQTRWVLWAAVVGVAVIGAAVAANALGGLPAWAESVVPAPAVLLIPAAIAIAILRHQLFDIDLLLNRTLLYLAVSGFLVAAYVGAVAMAGALLGRQAGLPPLAAGLAVALVFHPFRTRAQSFADRRLFGDPGRALRAFAEVSASEGAPAALVDAVADSLRLHHVRLELVDGEGGLTCVANRGEPRGAPLFEVPVTRGERRLGRMVVAARSARERLRKDELELLAAVAAHLAVATENEQLATEVRRSLRRTVHVAEEERRRLRRDLHDGLGARLTALGYTLEAARAAQSGSQAELLLGAKNDLLEAVAEVRRVIDDLRPAALDDLGLVPTVRAVADKLLSGAGIAFEDDLHALPGRVDAATEVAAYRIAVEAVTNAARHSGASRCRLSLHCAADQLELVCDDNGSGVPAQRYGGVGLRSMNERAVALGGQLEISAGNTGGTRVRAVLPLLEGGR